MFASSSKVLALVEELSGRGAHVPQEASASRAAALEVKGGETEGSSPASASTNDTFEAAATFRGRKPGWVFRTGDCGAGYYRDNHSSNQKAAADSLLQSEYYEISYRPGDGESLGLEVNVPTRSTSDRSHISSQSSEGSEPTLSKSRLLRGAKGLPAVEVIDNQARVAQYGVCVGDVVVAANGSSLLPAHANRSGLSGPTCSLGMRADPTAGGVSGENEEETSMEVLAGIVATAQIGRAHV